MVNIIRINELPEGSGSLSNDDIFVFMDDPSGSGVTKKISLNQISAAIGGGGGGNPFDQNLNTTDFPTFSGVNLTNNSSLAEGSFDSGVGGNGGISLNCTVGYELNWQAGHLRNIVTGDNTGTAQTIYSDSPIAFPGSGVTYMNVGSEGITFPDGTTQNTAPTTLPTVVQLGSVSGTINTNASLGDIFDLTLSASGVLANPSGGVDGQTLRWRITYNGSGIPLTLGSDFKIPSSASSPLPFSSTSGSMDILGATYDSSRNKWDVIAFVPGY